MLLLIENSASSVPTPKYPYNFKFYYTLREKCPNSKYGVVFGPYFPVFGLNTEIYYTGKYGPEITLYWDTFHAVICTSPLMITLQKM